MAVQQEVIVKTCPFGTKEQECRYPMKRPLRAKLFFVAVLVALILLSFLLFSPPNRLKLPDGTVVTLVTATVGNPGKVYYGSEIEQFFSRWIPDQGIPAFGKNWFVPKFIVVPPNAAVSNLCFFVVNVETPQQRVGLADNFLGQVLNQNGVPLIQEYPQTVITSRLATLIWTMTASKEYGETMGLRVYRLRGTNAFKLSEFKVKNPSASSK